MPSTKVAGEVIIFVLIYFEGSPVSITDAPWTGDPLKVSSLFSGQNHWKSPLSGLSAIGSLHRPPSDPHAELPL
jgi:hypothetical protein